MAEDMGSNFGKYIEQTIPTVGELISYKNCKEIRNNMIELIKYMMKDCVNNDQRAYVLQGTFNGLCSELSLVIRGKDHA